MSHYRTSQLLIGIILGIVLLAMLGCERRSYEGRESQVASNVTRVRFEQDKVTCYHTPSFRGGISCLKDTP